jgi:hypothetical protein
MPDYSFNDPKHWRDRAEQARAHAEQMTDREAKQTMLGIGGNSILSCTAKPATAVDF